MSEEYQDFIIEYKKVLCSASWKDILTFFPYRIQVKQALSRGDRQKRKLFCRAVLVSQKTVTVKNKRSLLRTYFVPRLQRLPVQMDHQWFQQDEATPHTTRVSMRYLREMFPDRILSRGSDLPWPSYSPDLTCPDFFLWGYLKDRAYYPVPVTLSDLKRNIRCEVSRLYADMVERALTTLKWG